MADPVDGALLGMSANSIAIESSTVTPAWIATLSQLTSKRNINLLDAPVSGSLPQAEARQLIAMVGGDPDAFEAAQPILAASGMAQHVGPVGNGAIFKLAVNALLGIQIAGWAEILGFLQKNGVDTTQALSLLTTFPISSPAGTGMAKLMVAHDFTPRFTNALLAKDFRYLQQTAEQAGSRTPLSNAASSVFESASEEMGGENVTSVIRFYE
ncbi:NAD(P)-dependent oxidoreductase [Silvibacterium sp.]|uniref:NAD(P)-dependent oxidoreductase n=1 Tax=Silvibacterium sp. TaxID=1964179 RepID=UPI0039E281A7